MQATVNFTQNNVVRSALLFCLIVLIGSGTSVAQTTAAPSDAQHVFEKMKALTGSWQGTVMGMSINVTFRPASSGTAILSEANGDGKRPPNHELTTFYVDGDHVFATHYCDGGNRSRMEGKLNGNTIEFNTVDVAGSTRGGFTKRIAFTIIDANKYLGELTYMMPDGKAVEARGEFQRLK